MNSVNFAAKTYVHNNIEKVIYLAKPQTAV